jgi:hypothetical protein
VPPAGETALCETVSGLKTCGPDAVLLSGLTPDEVRLAIFAALASNRRLCACKPLTEICRESAMFLPAFFNITDISILTKNI